MDNIPEIPSVTPSVTSRKKRILAVTVWMLLGAAGVLAAVDAYVVLLGRQWMYRDIKDLPEAQAVLVLGASVFRSGQMSDVFRDRATTALEIYNSGKAKKILVSGDYSPADYDEVSAAKKFFLEKGVPAEDIFLDYAGYDTYDSVYRAKYIFKVKSLIISTQEFHLPRALYLARGLGIEASGVSADLRTYSLGIRNFFRENAARAKAFWELAAHEKSEVSGDSMPITGDGRISWE
jgi:SanA protein